MDRGENQLLIFAKAPRVGLVKTRLAISVGPQRACDIYERLLRTLSVRLSAVEKATVCFAPDDAEPELRPFFPAHWRYYPQRGSDLGARLENAICHAFNQGASKVAVIGSDCPDLNSDDIANAWQKLDRSDVVFGPATDGGYWLIGMTHPHADLFRAIEWGTAKVLEQSRSRARDAHLKVALLRSLADIDTAEDWQAYASTLNS